MTLQGMKKFLNALKTAGIKNWEGINDIASVHYYNNEHCVNVLDESNETLYNFSRPIPGGSYASEKNIMVRGSNLADVHEVAFAGSFTQVKAFIDAFGLSLDEDQLKILVNIYGSNYSLKPVTGDYLTFKELSEDEISALSEEEKAEYEEAFKKFKNRNAITAPVQVIS